MLHVCALLPPPQRTIGTLAAFYLHSPKSVHFRGKGKAR